MSTRTPPLRRRVLLVGAGGFAVGLLVALGRALLPTGLQLAAGLPVLAVAAVCLAWAAAVAVRPVDELTEALVLVGPGGRLDPSRPDTALGRAATAFDEVLAERDAGLTVAAKLERRSGTFETRWRQVLEAAAEAYLAVDPSGIVVDVNQRATELLGIPRERLCGRPAAQLVPERHRGEVVHAIAAIAAAGSVPTGGPYEVQVLASDGRRFPAECTVWAVDRRGGTVVHAFLRDVSERRQAHEADARLAAVIEGSADAIVTQDLSGVIRTWNGAAERSFGWPAEETIGRDLDVIVPVAERHRYREAIARIEHGEQVVPFESECLTRGGTRLPVSVRLSPVHSRQGALVGISSLLRDITEQRWMAETLDTSLVALQEALDEARASEEVTRRFLSDAAHQLRTPVAGISACAETLLRGVGAEDGDRLLASMVRETSRAARLISSLLHMARLDQGLPVSREPVDVVALCTHEVERIGLLAPDLSVELELVGAPSRPLLLDASCLQEILSNLGDNARRHARSRVVVRVECRDERLRLSVCDDGPGLPEDLRERVFERFVSLDGRGGSGLGLPIARGLARLLGGDLRYDDAFVVELPAMVAASSAADLSSTSELSTRLSDCASSSATTA